jgi:hypothetical protein
MTNLAPPAIGDPDSTRAASLPRGDDPRADQTALAIALGGVICPVPFLMSGAAMRIASPRRSRIGRIAFWVGAATIAAQIAGISILIVLLAV